MNLLVELLEMALKGFHHIGEPKANSGFRDVDLAYMSKYVHKIEQRLVNAPDLEVFIIHNDSLASLGVDYPEGEIILDDNAKIVGYMQAVGNVNDQGETIIKHHCQKVINSIVASGGIKQDRIYFIMGDNYSKESEYDPARIVPTGWMLMHRLVHAAKTIFGEYDEFDIIENELSLKCTKVMDMLTLKMKSANDKRTPKEELINEMLVELLITGKLRYDVNPAVDPEAVHELVADIKHLLTAEFEKLKGRFFYI